MLILCLNNLTTDDDIKIAGMALYFNGMTGNKVPFYIDSRSDLSGERCSRD